MEFLTLTLLLFLVIPVYGGLEPPVNHQQLLKQLYGNPCDCQGGTVTNTPRSYTKSTDCGNKLAYLAYNTQITGISQPKWTCVNKPPVIPPVNNRPGPCPTECSHQQEMHITCYKSAQTCTGTDNATYYTAILEKSYSGSFGGETDPTSQRGVSKFAQASCHGPVGKNVCWPRQAPIHVSDGGGPGDTLKQTIVTERIQEMLHQLYPSLDYHPLALPKSRDLDLDIQTNNS